MAGVEGIVYSGFLRTKEQFIAEYSSRLKNKKFKEDFKQKLLEFTNIAKELMKEKPGKGGIYSFKEGIAATDQQAIAIKMDRVWNEIQQSYLSNPEEYEGKVTKKIGIITAFSIGNTGSAYILNEEFPAESDEKKGAIVKGRAKAIQIEAVKHLGKSLEEAISDYNAKVNKYNAQRILNEHYESYIAALGKHTLTTEQARRVHIKKYAKQNLTGRPFSIIYESSKSQLGNRYDGFLNHAGEQEPFIFDMISHPEKYQSFFDEASFVLPASHFDDAAYVFDLVMESKNNTFTQAGGDILILSEGTKEVILNNQLKSTLFKEADWKLAVNKIYTFALNWYNSLNNEEEFSPEELASDIFERLKIKASGFLNKSEMLLQEKTKDYTTNELLKEVLQSRKIQIVYKIS